ncbi:transporter substrate-binding domain-containing protein [Brevibacillus humidisoli]|uniref:transporter substrate-binding domain-containing protein n=1 Tax=Brevibacillus humidisoli TaxID=2895522 RepID=UPI001E44AE71|nr:transporter substrate-binding domain-containing protein [Brevibacillus humidisoli]UFJ41423.1 transporter substrate-binding domain-containing protein [Brevibacillus humidisoli]
MKRRNKVLAVAALAVTLLAGNLFTPSISAEGTPVPIEDASAAQVSKEAASAAQVDLAAANSGVMVPVEAVSQALGQTVTWDPKTKEVNIQSRLDKIIEQGYIRIGTTGDYKPFTYLNPETNEFEGYDIDAAKLLAKNLGVEARFVQTSWPTLMEDLLADKFDIAVGGITRNVERQKKAHLSQAYISFGKSPLIRLADKDRFKSLADIDQPDVKIGLNPGGTNEKFVRANIKNAEIIMVENNLEIPHMVAAGEVDVMITDNIEAMLYAKEDERLYAALTDQTFTVDEKGYLMHRGDLVFENWIELWMDEMKLKGEFDKLYKKWIE